MKLRCMMIFFVVCTSEILNQKFFILNIILLKLFENKVPFVKASYVDIPTCLYH